MRTIMDMLNDSASGNAAALMARQFGIAQEQVQAGMAALMPAFAEGMRRAMSDPTDFLKLMQAYATFLQSSTGQAMTKAGIEQGNAILGQLFGSKELSRAVAAQAAQATGLSTAILKSMLPAMAPKILEALFGQMFGGASGSQTGDNPFGKMFEQMTGGAGGQNPWGKMMEEMMRQGGSANPWGHMLEKMMGGAKDRSGPATGDNPLGRMFEEMLGQGTRRRAETSGRRQEEAADSERRRGPLEEMIGEMFDTGRTMQRDYQRGIETIFDQFVEGMKKR